MVSFLIYILAGIFGNFFYAFTGKDIEVREELYDRYYHFMVAEFFTELVTVFIYFLITKVFNNAG